MSLEKPQEEGVILHTQDSSLKSIQPRVCLAQALVTKKALGTLMLRMAIRAGLGAALLRVTRCLEQHVAAESKSSNTHVKRYLGMIVSTSIFSHQCEVREMAQNESNQTEGNPVYHQSDFDLCRRWYSMR